MRENLITLAALRRLLNEVRSGHFPPYGICAYIDKYVASQDHYEYVDLWPLWMDWEHYSGEAYPVPGGFEAYHHVESPCDRWRGVQLAYRISLIEHLIKKLEAICSAESATC